MNATCTLAMVDFYQKTVLYEFNAVSHDGVFIAAK